MNQVNYPAFAREALQITLLCLAVVVIFGSFGASDKTMLIAFTVAAISSAALYRHGKEYPLQISISCIIMGLSISLGGVIGYYSELAAEILTIVYATLAFYIPSTRQKTSVYVLGALMFLIFAAHTFTWQEGIKYIFCSVVVAAIFFIYYRFLILKVLISDYAYIDQPVHTRSHHEKRYSSSIALLSLSVAALASYVLHKEFHIPNIYWIELTILMVIQGPLFQLLPRTIMRMVISAFGAVASVVIFGMLLPPVFQVMIAAQTVILFMIFFTSFYYYAKIFFVEVFVLGFAYLIGHFHAILAFDRVVLSIVGGLIVIASTLAIWAADKLTPTTRHNRHH